MTTAGLSPQARDFNWLLADFAAGTLGVEEALSVSADGLLLAASRGRDRPNVDQICAIVSGLSSLTTGAARCFGLDMVEQVIIEMAGGYLFVARIGDGSSLAVVAARDADIGLIGYQMTLLINRVGEALTPALVDELQNMLR